MSFWTTTTTDPKRDYRFVVNFSNFGTDGCSWFVKNIDKPSISLSEASHEYLNHTFYYPGRVTWNSVSCTLVDPADPDAAATFLDVMSKAGYKPPSTAGDHDTITKSSAIDKLGPVVIRQLDGAGGTLEQWTLQNSWLKSVTLSGLDYSSDSLSEITVEIRYDFATLDVAGKGAGGDAAIGASNPLFALTDTTGV